MKTTVLHVARAPMTGVWAVMSKLGRWQRARGHRVVLGLILQNDWPADYWAGLEDLRRSGIEVFVAGSPRVFGTAAFAYHQLFNPVRKWADTLARESDALAVHIHNAWMSGAYLPIRSAHTRVLATFHGIAGERMLRVQPVRRRIHSYWACRLPKLGARLTTVDAAGAQISESLFGLKASLFTVIPNGTDPAPEGHRGGPRLNNPDMPLTVGHVGAVDDGKGWKITAAAVDQLRGQGCPVRFLMAGTGPDDAEAQTWCAQRPDYAEFLGFRRNPAADVWPRIDVLSLPSLSEGLPMAALEALAFGVPIIATPVGGLPSVIRPGENGCLIERKPEAVMNALRPYIDSVAAQARAAECARNIHRTCYSTEVMGNSYEKFYFGDV